MICSILLALAEAPYDASAKNYAFWLAKKEDSHIHALVVIDIAAFEAPVLGTADGLMPSVVTPPLKESQSLMNDLWQRRGSVWTNLPPSVLPREFPLPLR